MSHSVYVAFDIADEPLYVGRTSKGERRLRQHGKEREWWSQVYIVRVTHFATKEEAAMHEYELIRSLRPAYNVDVPTTLVWPTGWTETKRVAFLTRNPLILMREAE